MKQLLFILLILLPQFACSQIFWSYNQFFFNKSAINPAASGVAPFHFFQLTERLQWINIEGAPRTATINADFQLDEQNGLAFELMNDSYGAVNMKRANIAYAFHIPLSKSYRNKQFISLGASFTASYHQLQIEKLDFQIENDPVLSELAPQRFSSDAAFGVYYYSAKGYAGFTAENLIQHFSESDIFSDNTLNFNWIAGYRKQFHQRFDAEAVMIVRQLWKSDSRYEMGTKLYFWRDSRSSVSWLGFSVACIYSQKLQAPQYVLITGSTFGKKFFFTYSFEFAPNSLSYLSYGTHQLSLGLFIPTQKQRCPAFL